MAIANHHPIIHSVAALLVRRSTLPVGRLRFELNHALNVIEWLLQLSPAAAPELQLAALLHDCDRFFPERQITKEGYRLPDQYDNYKREHSKNSARIALELIAETDFGGDREIISQTIILHEFGGSPESNLLKDCDSLSFFDQNLIDYFQRNSTDATRHKISFMYGRMSAEAKQLWDRASFVFHHIDPLRTLVHDTISHL